jgi:hypothetical protein
MQNASRFQKIREAGKKIAFHALVPLVAGVIAFSGCATKTDSLESWSRGTRTVFLCNDSKMKCISEKSRMREIAKACKEDRKDCRLVANVSTENFSSDIGMGRELSDLAAPHIREACRAKSKEETVIIEENEVENANTLDMPNGIENIRRVSFKDAASFCSASASRVK